MTKYEYNFNTTILLGLYFQDLIYKMIVWITNKKGAIEAPFVIINLEIPFLLHPLYLL